MRSSAASSPVKDGTTVNLCSIFVKSIKRSFLLELAHNISPAIGAEYNLAYLIYIHFIRICER